MSLSVLPHTHSAMATTQLNPFVRLPLCGSWIGLKQGCRTSHAPMPAALRTVARKTSSQSSAAGEGLKGP